jgi:cbb3-type cytochrome c oxidase subunit III
MVSASTDQQNGKKLFQEKCAGCHALAAVGSSSTIGPNLDDAFASDRKQGYEEVTIQQVVRQQIQLAGGKMPANLVKGADADDVSAFVAASAGVPGQGGGANATSGKDIFTANCGSCHTLANAGTSGTVGPNLDDLKPALARVVRQVTNGGAIMPAFKGKLTDAQIQAVAKYVSSSAGKK